MNTGIAGLDKTLVPIRSLKVRLCSYGPAGFLYADKSILTPIATALLEADTNRFAPFSEASARNTGPLCLEQDHSVPTFAGHARQVTVDTAGCGDAVSTNGVLRAQPTAKWLHELHG